MAFGSSFFSLAGQKERLTNVGKYLQLGASKITAGIIPLPKNTDTGYRSTSNVGKIADLVVNNPKTAALAVTGAAYAVKKAPQIYSSVKSVVNQKTGVTVSNKQPSSRQLRQGAGMLVQKAGGMLKSVTSSPVPESPNAGIIKPAYTSSPKKAAVRRKSTPRKRRTAAKSRKKRSTKRTKGKKRRSKKKRFGTAKQYARKGGKSVKYTKNGQPYIILSDGRARFVKGKRK